MGYACPVCGEAQVDAEHLANHLAFTAILRQGDHETWLDEHVPDWSEHDPESLGPKVTTHAEEVEVAVPETDGERAPERPPVADAQRGMGTDRLSEADRQVLEEAREMTRKMLEGKDASESEKE